MFKEKVISLFSKQNSIWMDKSYLLNKEVHLCLVITVKFV